MGGFSLEIIKLRQKCPLIWETYAWPETVLVELLCPHFAISTPSVCTHKDKNDTSAAHSCVYECSFGCDARTRPKILSFENFFFLSVNIL